MIDAGKADLIGIASPKRVEKYPDVPTFLERGYNLNNNSWYGIAGTKGITGEQQEFWANAFRAAATSDAGQAFAKSQTAFVDVSTGDELVEILKATYEEQKAALLKLGLIKPES